MDVSEMNYLFATGVIKALEGNLFDKAKYAKLAKADHEDFVTALTSLGYGNGKSGDLVESVIDSEMATLAKLLSAVSPNQKYTDLFYFTFDAMNLKILYKTKMFETSGAEALVSTGAIPPEALKAAVLDNDLTNVPSSYHSLLKAVAKAVEGIDNPRKLSAIIDEEIFAYVFKAIKHCPGGSLQAYYKGFVDFANVIALMRSRALRWDFQSFSEMALKGGLIPLSVFEEGFALEGDALARLFQSYYNEKISKNLRQFQETRSLDHLERQFDALLLDIVGFYKNDSSNIGPIIYFFLKKQAEAKNIRQIYANNQTDLGDLLDV
jgi:vacuolar-type H+-ATPase subunit C/Vma6